MSDLSSFRESIAAGYTFKGEGFPLGAAVLGGQVLGGTLVNLPLRTMNRHGLIAGATGTGKTKTLQVLAEGLSAASVPVPMMDVKGDLSGIAAPGTTNEKIEARHAKVGEPYVPQGMPVELLSLSKEPGARLRATVSEFGPVLLGRILELNDTQQSVLALVFKYCDDNGLPLLDLKDLRQVVTHLTSDEGKADLKGIGGVSRATAGVILRALVNLEADGGDTFFGEPEFETEDLLRVDGGRGVISLFELGTHAARPVLFSTFLMWVLADLFQTLPEVGDLEKPKLVFVFDEAHLLFSGRLQGVPGAGRTDGQTDPLQRCWCPVLHSDADRHSQRGAQPVGCPHPARVARVHARRSETRASLPWCSGR